MPDDTEPTLPRRTAPTGPRSAGLRAVPPPALAPVIRLSPRTGRTTGRTTWPTTAAPAPAPLLVVLPDAGTDVVLSIQDRIRLRALEAASPQRGHSPHAEG